MARLFFDLADTVLSVLQALASAIDTIFGSNLAGSVQGWRDSLGGWVDSTFGKGEEIMEKLNAEDLHLGRFEYGAAFDMGYEFGQGVEDTVGGLFDFLQWTAWEPLMGWMPSTLGTPLMVSMATPGTQRGTPPP